MSSNKTPHFPNEAAEADWWSGDAGRSFVKSQSQVAKGRGSSLVARLNKKDTVHVDLQLSPLDAAKARAVAERKGVEYETFMTMLVHEALQREEAS